MIMSLFRRKEAGINQRIVDQLFEQIVAAARQKVIFANWGVPDMPLGRYESVGLHMIMFAHRARSTPLLQSLSEAVVDEFFKDLDHSIRELGIGDGGVPKRMKKLGKMFYGRMQAYWTAIDAGDVQALSAAITRNMAPQGAGVSINADQLASYVIANCAHLQTLADETILAGRLEFLPPQQV